MRTIVGILFLVIQLAGILSARLQGTAWPAWAPNDVVVDYRLSVWTTSLGELSAGQIQKRYGLPAAGTTELPLVHITTILEQRESALARKGESAKVTMSYRINNRSEKEWKW